MVLANPEIAGPAFTLVCIVYFKRGVLLGMDKVPDTDGCSAPRRKASAWVVLV